MWIWARHGNTFDCDEVPVYAGKYQDLPLVTHGVEQAHRLADAWLAFGVTPLAIYSGSLLRQRQTAAIVCQRLGWPPSDVRIDVRLDELDYGAWAGCSRQDIVAQFGEQSVVDWEQHSRWPSGAGWPSSAADVQQELADWMAQTHAVHGGVGPILAISSNGRLRYALTQVPGAFAARQSSQGLKVNTGHLGVLCQHAQQSRLICWNSPPAVAIGLLARQKLLQS